MVNLITGESDENTNVEEESNKDNDDDDKKDIKNKYIELDLLKEIDLEYMKKIND
jgi:hypothetical protein